MNKKSFVKQVSRIEYAGPYQISTTSSKSVSFSVRIDYVVSNSTINEHAIKEEHKNNDNDTK